LSRREKLFWLSIGAALIVLFLSIIPSHYEICEIAEKTQEKDCTSYQVVPFVGIKIAQILDKRAESLPRSPPLRLPFLPSL
jgi:hypothetical protein